jgi:2-C-methyl-D-erythritol 2,4-cyclodiphosphate synthase
MRVGHGFDAHRLGGDPPVVLGGVVVDEARGAVATSDGDVALHALTDALLGAGALGDLGTHFPSTDPRWENASSLDLLARAVDLVAAAGFSVVNVDVTIVAESIRVAPHREAMRSAIAGVLGVDVDAVSVKATTTDGLGFLGRDEGIAALATATLD